MIKTMGIEKLIMAAGQKKLGGTSTLQKQMILNTTNSVKYQCLIKLFNSALSN